MGGVERFGAMAFHIGTSVLVYLAASKPRSYFGSTLWLYCCTCVLNIPAGLYQAGAWSRYMAFRDGGNLVFAGACAVVSHLKC